MSPFLNLVRKDLRLLRWPWLGWLGVFLAKIALGAWFILTPVWDGNAQALRMNTLLTWLSALTACLLVARLVQADSPARPRAFWRTRPISGGQLLAAKATTAFLLFGLAPVLATLPWWLINGLGGTDLALAILELLLGHALVLVPVFFIASLVDTFSRAILWSVVQFGFILLLGLLPSPMTHLFEQGLEISRVILSAAVVALILPALAWWQFTRHRTKATIAALILLHVVAIGIWLCSPYDFAPRPAAWTELNPELGRGITLLPATADYEGPTYHGPEPRPAFIHSRWPVGGMPPGVVAETSFTSFVLAPDGADPIPVSSALVWPVQKLTNGNLRKLIGLPTAPGDSDSETTPVFDISYQLPVEQAKRLESVPVRATATVRTRLYRVELLQNQPLAPGSWYADRNGGRRIVQVDAMVNQVTVRYVKTQPESLIRRAALYWRTDFRDPLTHADLLFHPDDDQSVASTRDLAPELSILGVALRRGERYYRVPQIRRNGKWEPVVSDSAAWRAGMRLIRVAYHEEARVLLTGSTENFVVNGSPEEPAKNKRSTAARR